MPFEIHCKTRRPGRKPGRKPGPPAVTIRPESLQLSAAATAQIPVSHVYLLWDPDQRVLAFLPRDLAPEDLDPDFAFPLHRGTGAAGQIHCSAFLRNVLRVPRVPRLLRAGESWQLQDVGVRRYRGLPVLGGVVPAKWGQTCP